MKRCSCLSNLQDCMVISISGNCSRTEYMHAASVRQKWRGNKHSGYTEIPGTPTCRSAFTPGSQFPSTHSFFLLPNTVMLQRYCSKLLQFYIRLPFHSNVLSDARHFIYDYLSIAMSCRTQDTTLKREDFRDLCLQDVNVQNKYIY